MSTIYYHGYRITFEQELHNHLCRVAWESVDETKNDRMEKGGFFSKKDAVGYAKSRIDEHLDDLRQLGVGEE